jgi:hypothetical protein
MDNNRNNSRIALSLAFAAVLISSAASVGKPVSAQGNQTPVNFATSVDLVTGHPVKAIASDPADVAASLGNGTASSSEKTTLLQYIANVKLLLSQLRSEYNSGNYAQAEKLAVQAYLDNFENVEGPLVKAGKQGLKVEIEQMMRVELREKIHNKVSADELAAFISNINSKLGEAEKVFS